MAKINFENLTPLFQANKEFSLTESQYEQSVGKSLPKNFYYLKTESALAKEAKKHGYYIEIKEKTVSFKKFK